MTTGQKLQWLRLNRTGAPSQHKLQVELKIPQAVISPDERDVRIHGIPHKRLRRYAEYYGVSMDWLTDDSQGPEHLPRHRRKKGA